MKQFAQHGAMAGEKILEGAKQKLLDGVIFSPRDIKKDNLKPKIAELKAASDSIEILFDPQFYAASLAGKDEVRLGYLPEDYTDYFVAKRRQDLEKEVNVSDTVMKCLTLQSSFDVDALIGPNILIPRSLNSIETVIAKTFFRKTIEMQGQFEKDIYPTLSISRDALLDREELDIFLDELTALDQPPKGVYLLIGAADSTARFDIYHADILANWMLINYVFAINGIKVINGFSDLLMPLLGAVGGYAGATGWWSNLRMFSLDRFQPSAGGGRQPNPRYLSCNLYNRIANFELHRLRKPFPEILNQLTSDAYYDEANGSEPERSKEPLQSWDAIRHLNSTLVKTGDVKESLRRCRTHIDKASTLYQSIIAKSPFPRLEEKSNEEHLESIKQGIGLFLQKAEIKI